MMQGRVFIWVRGKLRSNFPRTMNSWYHLGLVRDAKNAKNFSHPEHSLQL